MEVVVILVQWELFVLEEQVVVEVLIIQQHFLFLILARLERIYQLL